MLDQNLSDAIEYAQNLVDSELLSRYSASEIASDHFGVLFESVYNYVWSF